MKDIINAFRKKLIAWTDIFQSKFKVKFIKDKFVKQMDDDHFKKLIKEHIKIETKYPIN